MDIRVGAQNFSMKCGRPGVGGWLRLRTFADKGGGGL